MAYLSKAFIVDYPRHVVPLSSILRGGMEAMRDGGYVKISNHTGRRVPYVAYRSAYAVLNEAIPKFYVYVKSPIYDLWEEFDGVVPKDVCRNNQMTTLSTESAAYQRMHTRMNGPPAFRIMVFDSANELLGAFDRDQVDLLA